MFFPFLKAERTVAMCYTRIMINSNAILLVALTTVIGALLGAVLIGVAIGLVIVLIATIAAIA